MHKSRAALDRQPVRSSEVVCDLAVRGPLIAVGKAPDPEPWGALSCAPLAVVAETYRAAGAEVLNLDGPGTVTRL